MEAVAELPPSFAEKQRASEKRVSADHAIKGFFGSNALVAIIVLALITVFLFREGFGFFGQNLTNIRIYRQSGQEYVDIIRTYAEAHTALSRGLNTVRLKEQRAGGDADPSLAAFDEFATAFSDAAEPLNGLLSDAGDIASALKAQLAAQSGAIDRRLDADEQTGNVAAVPQEQILAQLLQSSAKFESAATIMRPQIETLLANAPKLQEVEAQNAFKKWKEHARDYLIGLTNGSAELRAWSPDKPVPWHRA